MKLKLQPKKITTDPKPLGYLLFQPLGFGPNEVSPLVLKNVTVKFLVMFFGSGGRASGRTSSSEGHLNDASRIDRSWAFVMVASAPQPAGRSLHMAALRKRIATAVLKSPIARLPESAMATHAQSHRNSSEILMVGAFGKRSGASL